MNPRDLMAELLEGITPRRAPPPKVTPKHRDTISAWWELTKVADEDYPLAITTAEWDALDPLRHQNPPQGLVTVFGHTLVEVPDWSLL
jgi:hypothetical protein